MPGKESLIEDLLRTADSAVSKGGIVGRRTIMAGLSNVRRQLGEIKEDVHEHVPFVPFDPRNPTTQGVLEYNAERAKKIAQIAWRDQISIARRFDIKHFVRDVKVGLQEGIDESKRAGG